MKILLGGIPLGCDNVGDESIIGCVVELFRGMLPTAELTVSTAKPEETAGLLHVECIPLLGFAGESIREIECAMQRYDCFVWAGATGLSDYPQVAVNLLTAAQRVGVRVVVWSVGMDSELNPAFFRVGGKKKRLFRFLSRLTGGKWDGVKWFERWLCARMKRRIAAALVGCDAVFVRDEQSQQELVACGFSHSTVSADSALLQATAPDTAIPKQVLRWCRDGELIGVCLSAQRAVQASEGLRKELDRQLDDPDKRIVFIPMNPVTDAALMAEFRAQMRNRERTLLVVDCPNPAVVQAIAMKCSVIISSRLHLLILASNVDTPVIGIGRGSKIDNFLANFGLAPAGTFDACDITHLRKELARLLERPTEFCRKNHEIRPLMLARLRHAEETVAQLLAK